MRLLNIQYVEWMPYVSRAVDAAERGSTAGAIARKCADARRRRAERHARLSAELSASVEDPNGVPEHCTFCKAQLALCMP